MTEGGAELIRALLWDQMGIQSLEERKAEIPQQGNAYSGFVSKFENLWGLHSVPSLELLSSSCPYNMGEHFLLEVHDAIGTKRLAAAIRDMPERLILPDSRFFPDRIDRERVREEELYLILLEHTPVERLERLQELYREVHGGPFLPSG